MYYSVCGRRQIGSVASNTLIWMDYLNKRTRTTTIAPLLLARINWYKILELPVECPLAFPPLQVFTFLA